MIQKLKFNKKLTLLLVLFITSLSYSQEKTEPIPTIQETLQPYVENLLQNIQSGVEIASKEIPEVLIEYIMFYAVKAWILIILSFILLYITIKSFKYFANKFKNDYSTEGLEYAIALLPLIISSILFFTQIFTAIKATFFPKLFLIEEFLKFI